jgi:hypothetical protein
VKLAGSLQQTIPEVVAGTESQEHGMDVNQVAKTVAEVAVSEQMRGTMKQHVFGR